MKTPYEIRQELQASVLLPAKDRIPALNGIRGELAKFEKSAFDFAVPLNTLYAYIDIIPDVNSALERAKAVVAREAKK